MCRWMESQIFYFSHANHVDHDWAVSRTVEELDAILEDFMMVKKQYDTWNEFGDQFYFQEQNMERRTYRA